MRALVLLSVLSLALVACDGESDCTEIGCACEVDSDCSMLGSGGECVLGTCQIRMRTDAGTDAGPGPMDAGRIDAGASDAGGSDSGGADAGAPDTGVGDAGPTNGRMGPAVGYGTDLSTLMAADLTCTGVRTAPAPGAAGPRTFRVETFGSGDPVVGMNLHFWDNNLPSTDGSCGAGCVMRTSGAGGQITATAPMGAWVGYRLPAQTAMVSGLPENFVETVQVNAAPGFIAVAITEVLANQIVLLIGTSRMPGTVTLTGRARECNGEDIANAYVRVYGDAGEIALGFTSAGPREFYFNGSSFPSGSRRATHIDGLWGVANLPVPPSGRLRVELWGSTVDSAPAERLGCEVVNAPADGVGIVNIGPLRSDGPSGC